MERQSTAHDHFFRDLFLVRAFILVDWRPCWDAGLLQVLEPQNAKGPLEHQILVACGLTTSSFWSLET